MMFGKHTEGSVCAVPRIHADFGGTDGNKLASRLKSFHSVFFFLFNRMQIPPCSIWNVIRKQRIRERQANCQKKVKD